MVSAAIEIKHLSKTFKHGKKALDSVSLKLLPGEMVAVIGASGAGKSTLLKLISCLTLADRSQNSIRIFGQDAQSNGKPSVHVRAIRRQVGLVFQQFNLVGRLDVLTNVLIGGLGRMPPWRTLLRIFLEHEKREALQALERMGLLDLAGRRASTLSGGEQQRTAIARVMMQHARIVLADEPVASLDQKSALAVMENLADLNRAWGVTVFVSLHQVEYASLYCPRTIALEGGRIAHDGPTKTFTTQQLEDIYGDRGDGSTSA